MELEDWGVSFQPGRVHRVTALIHSLFLKIVPRFSSFDFLDERHIVYGSSVEDTINVYDFHVMGRAMQEELGHLRFQLELPPTDRVTASSSRYIQVRPNVLPFHTQEPHVGSDFTSTPSPFRTDPHARLVVICVTNPFVVQFELHVPAQALSKHVAARQDACGRNAAVPWSAWCADMTDTHTAGVFIREACMIACGMCVVSHPPGWGDGLLHVESYTPRRADTVKALVWTRQGVPVSDTIRLLGKEELLSVLCKDALFCYKVQ